MLQIVKLMRAEASRSTELRHLLSMCLTQAQQVDPEARLFEVDAAGAGDTAIALDLSRPTLILGDADVLVARRSLEAMLAALGDGRAIAVASPLGSFDAAADQPVFSLSDYEELERTILAAAQPSRQTPTSHLPVALVAPGWLRRALPDGDPRRLLSDAGLLATTSRPEEVAFVGMYFELADYYGQRRDDILPLLPASARRALEVGCGRGFTAQLVGDRLGCPVVGVELNPEIARQAGERMERVIVGDVLAVDIDGNFDVIIATEVLEHIEDTAAFLRRMLDLLEPGGRLIMSVPNVGHYSVVEDLARGRWDYVPAGLLCITHVRFFTRASLAEWCRRVGFSSVELYPQTTDLPARLADLAALPGADRESLRTHGFLVVCTR